MKNNLKKDFKIFKNKKSLIYLDSAATAQTPDFVIEKMDGYYEKYEANVHRGLYRLAQEADAEFEGARKKIADFINSDPAEVIFTSGATHGLNLLASSLSLNLKKGDNVVLTRMEHHANLVPWQEAAKRRGFEIRFIELTDDYRLDLKNASQIIDNKTKIVSLIHASNTLGTVNPVKDVISLARKAGALTILDSSQFIAHRPVDVKGLDCDFLVFSGHKLYGPTGIGILYGKKKLLDAMEPFMYGGDMISEVSYERSTWNTVPNKFEAGTPNISGAIGLGAAVDYVQSVGYGKIKSLEDEIKRYFAQEFAKLDGVKIVGPGIEDDDRLPLFSFVVEGAHPHDVAEILSSENVCIRAGHHCTMPLLKLLGVKSTCRASFSLYNDERDVDALIAGIRKAQAVFKQAK